MSTPESEAKAATEAKAKSEAAAAAAAKVAAEAEAKKNDSLLVEVKKDGKKLRVHPTCVKDHERVGWVKQ